MNQGFRSVSIGVKHWRRSLGLAGNVSDLEITFDDSWKRIAKSRRTADWSLSLVRQSATLEILDQDSLGGDRWKTREIRKTI